MKIAYTSKHGVIIDLGKKRGFRLVGSKGRMGPVLPDAASIAQHMPYTEFYANDGKTDLDTWLEGRGLTQADLLEGV